MLRHLEPNKLQHFLKQKLFLKNSGWPAVWSLPAGNAAFRIHTWCSCTVSVLLNNLSICLHGMSPALKLAWSLSGVPKQHGFGLTVSVTASVTSSARSPSAVTALLFLLDCYLRLVFHSRWPFSSVSENDRETLMQSHRVISEYKIINIPFLYTSFLCT